MRVVIAALGTRGDVLPFVVLGRGFADAGHDVLVSTTESFRALVQTATLGFDPLPGDPQEALRDRPLEVSAWRPVRHLRVVHRTVEALVEQTDASSLTDRWGGREHVIFSGSTTFAHAVARRLGVPATMVAMTPMMATGRFAAPVLTPYLDFGRQGNLASWLLAERLQRQTFQEPLRPGRRRAWRLPRSPVGRGRARSTYPPFPLVHAYSPAVCPRPDDWPPHVRTAGWLLPATSAQPLPGPVEDFLRAGPPPLYVGFGSMPVPDPQRTAQMLVQALGLSGQRAIVCGGELARAPALQTVDTVLAVSEVPHERLFERVRAVVHHGGSGTVGAGLRAGRPTLVSPVIFDQFFWGERVRRLGAGPRPLPLRALSADRLAERLRALTGGRYDAAAAELRDRILADDPVAAIVAEIGSEPRGG